MADHRNGNRPGHDPARDPAGPGRESAPLRKPGALREPESGESAAPGIIRHAKAIEREGPHAIGKEDRGLA